jgi:hypothetical protein
VKIFFSTWLERSQKRTLDKLRVRRRLISYAHIRSAKSKDARLVLEEYKADMAARRYREGYDKINWGKKRTS